MKSKCLQDLKCITITYDIFLHMLLVQGTDTLFEQLGVLDVANAVVQIGLEATHNGFHIPNLNTRILLLTG